MSSAAPPDRVRTLLLRADNVLKNEGDPDDRERRARGGAGGGALRRGAAAAWTSACVALIERRLAALEAGGPG